MRRGSGNSNSNSNSSSDGNSNCNSDSNGNRNSDSNSNCNSDSNGNRNSDSNSNCNNNEDANLKERILLFAIEEFSSHSYNEVSTNVIVSRAEVSKGLLFHYFGSKENLFLKCAQYAIGQLMDYIDNLLDFTNVGNDVLERFRYVLEIKMRFYNDYPKSAGLLFSLWYTGYRSAIEGRIREHIGYVPDFNTSPIYENADLTKLNEGLDIRRVLGYAGTLIDSCWLRFSNKYNNDSLTISKHTDEFLAEADIILDIIIRGAYKTVE